MSHREITIAWDLSRPLPELQAPEGFSISKAGPDDLPALAALAVEAYRGPWDWWLKEVGEEWARRHFLEGLKTLSASPAAEVFTVRSGKTLAGSSAATFAPDEDGDHIPSYGLVVRPEFRGRGLGKFLLHHALRWLRERGVKTAQVTTTAYPKDYPQAVGNYLNFGGKIISEADVSGA